MTTFYRLQLVALLRPNLPSVTEVPYEYLSEDWAFRHYGDYPYTMKTAFIPHAADDTQAGPKVTL